MAILGRILFALAVALVVWLVCVFFGGLLALTHAPLMAYVGAFIETWAVLIAVIAFLFAFFSGSSVSGFWRRL